MTALLTVALTPALKARLQTLATEHGVCIEAEVISALAQCILAAEETEALEDAHKLALRRNSLHFGEGPSSP